MVDPVKIKVAVVNPDMSGGPASPSAKPKTEEPAEICKKLKDSFGFRMPGGLWKVPKNLRTHCAREFYKPAELQYYSIHTNLGEREAVSDPKELLNTEAHAQLLQFFYPQLQSPPPVQRHLTEIILRATGRKKLSIVFSPEASKRFGGWADLKNIRVLLVDTLSESPEEQKVGQFKNGQLSHGTLTHEIGHLVMGVMYRGQLPNHEGFPAHNLNVRPLIALTSPGAAWSEGFANAMGDLDHGECMGNVVPSDYNDEPEWGRRPIQERVSNEFVIGAVLRDYIKPDSSGIADINRLGLVLRTMQTVGLQQSFSEFVADFAFLNPEGFKVFSGVLTRYKMADVASKTPNYLERRLQKFVNTQRAVKVPSLGWDRVAGRKGMWEMLCRRRHVDVYLLNTRIPIRQRLDMMERVDGLLKEAERDYPNGTVF